MLQGRDILSQLGKDFTDSIVKRFLPKPRSPKGGRPPKPISWDEAMKRGSIVGKFALPGAALFVLVNKGQLTWEQASMVLHYILEKHDEITVIDLYPTSDSWIVRRALKEFGFDNADSVDVKWEEIMRVGFQLITYWSQVQAQAAAGVQPQVIDWRKMFAQQPLQQPQVDRKTL